MREMKKGSLSLLVLHLLYERPSYGYELCERLRARSEGELSFEDAAIYPLLHTYERESIVEGYWEADGGGSAGAERRGPRRRYYRLTPRGVEALRVALREWQTFSRAVGRIVGNEAVAGEEGAR
jgi:PadR family transcriptional regulator, regulatory protein PadR